MIKVETPCRLHFGFSNLSLSRSKIYGGIGATIQEPKVVLKAKKSNSVEIETDKDYERVEDYVKKSVNILDIDGVKVKIEETLPGHVGLGSGTQLALSIFIGIAKLYNIKIDIRKEAPKLGRGGRSGVGVAAFEKGGFIVDSGHNSEDFTRCLPENGGWNVPKIINQHDIPENWRFLVVIPDAKKIYGEEEEKKVQETVFNASYSIADKISSALIDKVLPGIAEGNIREFSEGITKVNRLNGSWFSKLQGGVYRKESKNIIEKLRHKDLYAVGQSSWGPTVYGITIDEKVDGILEDISVDNDIIVAKPNNSGAKVKEI